MFSPSLFTSSFFFKKCTSTLMHSIVYSYVPQRSPYDKTSYIEKYIPRPIKFHKTRKPRLSQWTDPKIHWHILLPPPTKLQGKALIKTLEKIEKKRIIKNRTFRVVAIRAGDVIRFKYYLSLSEKKFNIHTGLVLGTRRKNSLDGTIRVLFRFCGALIEMNLKKYSPYLAEFRVVGRGRVRQGKIFKMAKLGLSQNELMRPIVRGKNTEKKDRKTKTLTIDNQSVKQDKVVDPLLQKLDINKKK